MLTIISNHEKDGTALKTEGGGGEMFSDPEEKMVLIWGGMRIYKNQGPVVHGI